MGTITLAVLKSLLLPPGLCLWPAAAALPLRRNPRIVVLLLSLSVLSLYLFSTPLVARALAGVLEQRHGALAPDAALTALADAIVVPGCDRYANGPEFGRDEVSPCTLARLRYAVELQQRTGLPLLLSGGRPLGEPESEAALMDRALRTHFGVAARWLEEDSRNTAENAARSAALLDVENVRRVLLVTHAMHMPRAVRSFRRHGLTPVAAPTQFFSIPDRRPAWFAWLPAIGALHTSALACHELVGLAWYAISGK